MSEPKFSVGQRVLVFTPYRPLPVVDAVESVMGYFHEGQYYNGNHQAAADGWFYTTTDLCAHESCLRPIQDPDTDHTTTDELERTA